MLGRPDSILQPGVVGDLEVVVQLPEPEQGEPLGWAVLAHPHPQFGGTMDNKVVHTMARAFLDAGFAAIRFNFRGIGRSEGQWDQGRGEIDDMLAVVASYQNDARWTDKPCVLAGFSFGGHVAIQSGVRLLGRGAPPLGMVLVSPSVENFSSDAAPVSTLVLQGDEDDVVPMADVLKWARPQQLPVTVLPGAGHFFHGQLGGLKPLITRYLRDLLQRNAIQS